MPRQLADKCTCTQTFANGKPAHEKWDCPDRPAAGCLCHKHFGMYETRGYSCTAREQAECPDCQQAQIDYYARIQREHTSDPSQPYGQHIALTCRKHPNLRWSTKNIDYIGARSIFYFSDELPECDCPLSDLIVVK